MTSSLEPNSAAHFQLPSRPGSVSPKALADARHEALNIVQWLARIANSYVSNETQEGRLTLGFCVTRMAFVTKTFNDRLALEVRLPTLEMQFLEYGNPVPHVFDPEEHTPAKVEAWLLVELLHRGVDRGKFSKMLPYQVPGLLSGDEEHHSPRSCAEGLQVLTSWFRSAASVLEFAAGGTAKLACWPQDLRLTCRDRDSADFGFSPGDAEHPEPYFYRSPHSRCGSGKPVSRSILPASAVLAGPDPMAAAKNFFAAN